MKNWIIVLVASGLCGCATPRHTEHFPRDQIAPDDAGRLAHVHLKLDEPPFWQSHGSPLPKHHLAYRLTVLPSQPFAVCVTVHRGQTHDSILRTKVYTWSYKQPVSPHKAEVDSEKLIFDESRVLSESKAYVFDSAFHALDLAADNFPPGFHSFFSSLDGTSFFLEASEFGRYRLIQINDPAAEPLTSEARDMLIKVFPDLDVDVVQPFIQKYLELLRWMAEETNLAILEEYREIPNKTNGE